MATLASAGAASSERVRTQGLGVTEKVDVDVVQVTVTVTNDCGEFVAGLPQCAFHVLEDGKPQTDAPTSRPKTYRWSWSSPLTSAAA